MAIVILYFDRVNLIDIKENILSSNTNTITNHNIIEFQQLQQIDLNVVTLLLSTSINLSTLFLYCYFGGMASDSYKQISDCVYNTQWYKLHNRLQKFFVLIIANMQKPLYYHGFGIFILDLGTFIRVSFHQYQHLRPMPVFK